MIFTSINPTEIVLGLIAFFASSTIGLAVYIKNPNSWTNRFFLMLSVVICFYIGVNYLSLHPPGQTPESQLFWIRVVMFSASFMSPILFLLVHTFPRNEIRFSRALLTLICLSMLLAAGLSVSPFVFSGIQYPEGQPVPVPDIGMAVFVLNFVGFLILSFINLFAKYRSSQGQERAKVLYLLFGVLATFSLMTVFTVGFVVIAKSSAGVFLGPIFPVILMAAIGYAIVKHRFLDIQPIIARAVSFVTFLLLLAIGYALIFLVVFRRLLDTTVSTPALLLFMALTVIAMLSFQPLEKRIKKWSGRYFLRAAYDKDELLSRLTHIMAENIDLKDLSQNILDALMKSMRLSRAAFLLIDSHAVSSVQGIGYGGDRQKYTRLEKLLHNGDRGHVVLDELEESELKTLFRELEIAFAAPIRVEKKETAVLILGPKLSGESYYANDIDVLDIFSAEAGIAIENAKAYEEIKQFNKELEGKVEQRTHELKESQKRELDKALSMAKLKDEYVFLAAHELRTPVTVIRGFLEMIEDSQSRISKDVKSSLGSIGEASRHLNDLLNDLLEIARADAGTTKLTTVKMDILPVVRGVVKDLMAIARKRKITIEIAAEPGLGEALADAGKLKEILINLIGNAVKYNREGGRIVVSATANSGQVAVDVRDTGFGIPKDQQQKIFEKFFRAQSREVQEITGTGLGLFIAKMLTEKMGGRIWFVSEEGKGSTFSFSLPAAI